MMPSSQQLKSLQPNAADAAAANARAIAQQLTAIMDELTQLMAEETPLVLAQNYNNQNEFLRRKQELTLNYQSVMKVFTENQDLLKSLSQQDIAVLREKGKQLDAIAHDNTQALRHAHFANENLLRVVIHEIRKDMQKESGYSSRGVMALAEAAKARPVSYNQRI